MKNNKYHTLNIAKIEKP